MGALVAAAGVWELVHKLLPELVGGCRTQTMQSYLGTGWQQVRTQVVHGGWMCSEVIVARRGQQDG